MDQQRVGVLLLQKVLHLNLICLILRSKMEIDFGGLPSKKGSPFKMSAFTLVEMLLVMAVLIILMGIGVMGGRMIINRANEIKNRDSLGQLNKAALQYYGDNGGVFPSLATPDEVISTGELSTYLEELSFGSDSTVYYFVSEDRTKFLFCSTTNGFYDANDDVGVLCEGSGFGVDLSGVTINTPTLSKEQASGWLSSWEYKSNWNASLNGWDN